jgi:CheY-like chemotaxis protein
MDNQLALVIEDNKDLATIFSLALEMAGFETEIMQAGDAAITRLAELEPHLVVMDMHLPGAAGEDIVRHIRSDARLEGTYIVAVTGDPFVAEDIRSEVDLVLLKPFSLDRLQVLATRLLAGTAADEDLSQ